MHVVNTDNGAGPFPNFNSLGKFHCWKLIFPFCQKISFYVSLTELLVFFLLLVFLFTFITVNK